jgi:putative sugar O-methyltransferase
MPGLARRAGTRYGAEKNEKMISLLKKIGRVAKRATYGKLEILAKSKDYRDDRNYKPETLEACFANRVQAPSDDRALLERIVNAYNKGSKDQLARPELFRPSNEWLPIYRKYLGSVIDYLEKQDIENLDKTYRNYFRDDCSTGLVGLHGKMQSAFFGRKISYLSRLHYLNDSIHRFNLWQKQTGNRYPITALDAPLIGNPYGYFIDGKFVKSGSDYQHYYAAKIIDLVGIEEKRVVAEIGAGYGGMAYYLMRDAGNATFVDFDLPENLALTSYYLLKSFPDKKFLLYGEGTLQSQSLTEYDVVLMPSFELDVLPPESFDLIFNSYSLAEMSKETIDHYVRRCGDMLKNGGWFFHVNHTKKSQISARDFPIPADLKLVSEEIAAWNFGRNPDMDEYEFLYQKNGTT